MRTSILCASRLEEKPQQHLESQPLRVSDSSLSIPATFSKTTQSWKNKKVLLNCQHVVWLKSTRMLSWLLPKGVLAVSTSVSSPQSRDQVDFLISLPFK